MERRRLGLLRRAIRDFDIVHFNFGQTILQPRVFPDPAADPTYGQSRLLKRTYFTAVWMADLPLLRALGKGIAMTYQGDDARQGDYCRSHFAINAADKVEPGYYSEASDSWKRRSVAKVARYADRIYALNPDLLHVLPASAKFMPYASVDPREWQPGEAPTNAVPHIVHAPTHRGVKGTPVLLAALDALRAENIGFEFTLIENMPHAEARAAYSKADILVDQLLLGWYGGLAVEFMALAKPVVCYLREDDLGFLPKGMRADLPIIQATPDSLRDVLRDLLTTRRAELAEIGRRSRRYVETWHDPLAISRVLVGDYKAILGRDTAAS